MSRHLGNNMPFDVDRWRSDEEVALLGCVGRTVWFEALMVMWKRDRNGELSGTYAEIAKLCRVSPAEAQAGVREIKARNVGDVTESNGVVTLINRAMKRDHENRVSVRERVSNHRVRKRGNAPATPDVTGSVTRLKQRERVADPPPTSPSPRPSPPIPPTSVPISSKSGSGVAAIPGAAPPKKTRETKLSTEQQASRLAFQAWWIDEAYPRSMHGEVYPFDGKTDGPAVMRILSNSWIRFDLNRAKSVAEAYLTAPDAFIAKQGRPLSLLSRQMHAWIHAAQLKQKGKHHVQPSNGRDAAGVRPGEYPQTPGILANLARQTRERAAARVAGESERTDSLCVGATGGGAVGGGGSGADSGGSQREGDQG